MSEPVVDPASTTVQAAPATTVEQMPVDTEAQKMEMPPASNISIAITQEGQPENTVDPLPGLSSEALAAAVSEVTEAMLAAQETASQDPGTNGRPNKRKRNSPCFFTQTEDVLLTELVEKQGPHAWSQIALSFPSKNGKQCRARWYTHLDPSVKKSPFAIEEDALLLSKHAELGNSWSTIAQALPGRTELSVRNRWNVQLRNRVETSGMTEAQYAQRLTAAAGFGAAVAQTNPTSDENPEGDKKRSRQLYSCVGFTQQDLKLSLEPSAYKNVQDRLARVVMVDGEEARKAKVKVGMVVLTVNDAWCPALSFQETFTLIQNTTTRPIYILFGDESLLPDNNTMNTANAAQPVQPAQPVPSAPAVPAVPQVPGVQPVPVPAVQPVPVNAAQIPQPVPAVPQVPGVQSVPVPAVQPVQPMQPTEVPAVQMPIVAEALE